MLYAMDQKCVRVVIMAKTVCHKNNKKVRTMEHGVSEKAIITPKM